MALDVVAVGSRRTARDFLRVPFRVYRGDPNWIAPLDAIARQQIDRKHNPFFVHAETEFWVAYRDGEAVGRISAQVNRLHLERHNDATGHFGLLEAIDDPAVFAALFETAEQWLAARGMTRVLGPFNLSINEDCGMLVSGFETPPMVMMGHGRPHFARHTEALGYRGAKDLNAYLIDLEAPLPAEVDTYLSRASARGRITVRNGDVRNLDVEIRAALDIYNDALSDNWCFIPFTPPEMAYIADSMKMLIEPDNIVFADYDGEPAGILLALPNLNEAARDLKGKLFPFGWLKLLFRLKRGLTTGRILLLGIRKSFHGSFTGALLTPLMLQRLRERGPKKYRKVEFSWILEDNVRMLDVIERSSAALYKKYRLYEKAIGSR